MKNKLTLAFLFLLLSFSLTSFAYAETVFECNKIDNFSNEDFDQVIASYDYEDSLFEELCNSGDGEIDKFFRIKETDADREDKKVMREVEKHITENFQALPGDIFASRVIRNQGRRDADGWYVVSHFSSSSVWSHYLFYYHVNF